MESNEYKLDLTLCMIAKNEEHFLSKHLPVMLPLVSEFVFVDTGSTDRSIEIAGEYGAKIFKKEWQSDFAEVRNFALKKASKKWILVLDADEVISPKDFSYIKECLEKKPDVGGFVFRQRNYLLNLDSENWMPNLTDYEEGRGYTGFMDVSVVRIFENKPHVHYTGAAHDLVEYSIAKRPKVDTGLPIHHYGMARGLDKEKEKDEEYLKQLEKDVQNHPELFKTRYTLGRLLFRLKRYKEAEIEFLKALEIRPRSEVAFLNLGMTYYESGDLKKAKENLRYCLQINGISKEAWNSLGVVEASVEAFSAAEECFRKAVQINPQSPKFKNNLALALFSQSKQKEAQEILQPVINKFPEYVPALTTFLKILVSIKDNTEAVKTAKNILNLDKSYAATVQEIINRL
ncbi:MAG: tetratricopeptide repeat protein [Candidatus Aureabacteria bacterium]|nr:tetratricopeptide repeat protein [Candidatus Auribacterota bacterium]